MTIEIVDDIIERKPGRPVSERVKEIQDALQLAIAKGKRGLIVPLMDDERGERFVRFNQRARSAAEQQGVKISVAKDGSDTGRIRILDSE